MRSLNLLRVIFLILSCWCLNAWAASVSVPILTYHNFEPALRGSMTISTAKFEEQLQWLKKHGFTIIPLQQLVSYLEGKNITLPAKPVVITADDGRITVYKYMYPIVRKYNIPVTLFVYPSAISNAHYAMTWEQLRELQKTGLFDIQSHTYWHPNFNQDKKELSAAAYQQLVYEQLTKSKQILEEKLDKKITLLAWPYGIYNPYLEQAAAKTGYAMAFSIDDRLANRSDNKMTEPRYMIQEGRSMKIFAEILAGKLRGSH